MTDRVLLELAAKATGRKFNVSRESPSGWLLATQREAPDGSFVENGVWRPLTDDGDAFRLALKLGICIVFMEDHDSVGAEHSRHGVMIVEAMDDFGTRRAIVRAAAEIGKITA